MNAMKETLKTLILTAQNRLPLSVIDRNLNLPVGSGKIVTVTGVRRSGKSFLLFDTMNRLLEQGVSKEKILFINFDDERLLFSAANLDLILQAYRELYPSIRLDEVYFFFDEVQMATGWEPFIRRVYDTENKQLFITGSNAKLLASEIASSLRGRTLQFEVFPLTFDEYCRFSKTNTNWLLPENRAAIETGFMQFLTKGGFPELVLNGYSFFENTVQEYYHVMMFKDLIERFEIRNIPVLKYLVARLVASVGKPTSINKIYNELRSAGLKADKNLLYTTVDHLQSIYFVQRIGKFDLSILKTELASEKKTYFIDNSFLTSLSYSLNNDFSRLFENLIFLWLRGQSSFGRGLFFAKGRKECDFLITDREKAAALIQACWSIEKPETIKQEVDGLIQMADYFSCDNLIIVTASEDREMQVSGRLIKVVPAWKIMMENRQLP
jgi:predicted AAA+ superfamily ATPase